MQTELHLQEQDHAKERRKIVKNYLALSVLLNGYMGEYLGSLQMCLKLLTVALENTETMMDIYIYIFFFFFFGLEAT